MMEWRKFCNAGFSPCCLQKAPLLFLDNLTDVSLTSWPLLCAIITPHSYDELHLIDLCGDGRLAVGTLLGYKYPHFSNSIRFVPSTLLPSAASPYAAPYVQSYRST